LSFGVLCTSLAQLSSILDHMKVEFPYVQWTAGESLTPEVRATIVLCERETRLLVRKFVSACVGNDIHVTLRGMEAQEFPVGVPSQPTLVVGVSSPAIVSTTDIAFYQAVEACSTCCVGFVACVFRWLPPSSRSVCSIMSRRYVPHSLRVV
jgi:hypothetical protein